MDERKKELLECFKGADGNISVIIEKLIDDAVFLEIELEKLRKLPHIRINPKNPYMQEALPASKIYASFISRYADIINRLTNILRREEIEDVSPLRAYLNNLEIR